MKKETEERREKLSKSAASGAVALIFLILGFQVAIFVMKVVQRLPSAEMLSDSTAVAQSVPVPDAGYGDRQAGGGASCGVASCGVASGGGADGGGGYRRPSYGRGGQPYGRRRQYQQHQSASEPQRSRLGGYEAPEPEYQRRPPRSVESFPFDPNTVSIEDLVRLGLSERQAESIENYRAKGGRFRTKSDFKKMYVVSDSLYARLEPFIDIPKVELNTADSTALVSLYGIGPFYARKILEYRESLGGYYAAEQLMEVYGMDEERFAPLKECVTADPSLIHPLDIWALPEDSLARHPYVGRATARSIVRYRRVCPDSLWSTDGLLRENVLDSAAMTKLKHYLR